MKQQKNTQNAIVSKLNIENPKKVSVIIPNYNYGNFLTQRIDSVLSQTYPIFELIILDDASTDNSCEVIENYLEKVEGINKVFVKNESNSGCVFKQWKKGFELATGDVVWIAEADDLSDCHFLETVIKGFDNEKTVISCCESSLIDEMGKVTSKTATYLYDYCKTGDWKKDYTSSGEQEIIRHLSGTNTILNVSAVLWKNQDYSDILAKATEYKVAGDWFIYYNVLKQGDFAWFSKPLNYFRKHSKSVSTIVKAELEFAEICRIQNMINNEYNLSEIYLKRQKIRRSYMYNQLSEETINRIENDNGKKKIAWIVPYFDKGSGGFRTIFQNVNNLVSAGYECDLYFEENHLSMPNDVKKKIDKYYGGCKAEVYIGISLKKDYDVVFATGWTTVKDVKRLNHNCKAYFVQDFEPWFMPMGENYIVAENSYKLGFNTVTIGKWLANKLSKEYGANVGYFDFCADLSTYKVLPEIKKENAICFVYQPEKARRCDIMGAEALKIVKKLRPKTKIYVYGSNESLNTVDCENLNLISIEECNELYNKCKVGLCLSASNPSRIPFEMMSAGLPVVEMYGENNLYDLPQEGVLLAKPTPEAIAAAIIELLDNDEKRVAMSQFGSEYMKAYPLQRGYKQFCEAVEKIINGELQDFNSTGILYTAPAFEETEETLKVAKENKGMPLVDNSGKNVRFARRVLNKLKLYK